MFIDKCPASAASQYFVKCWKDILGKRMQLILLIWFDIEHANYLTQLTKLKKKKKKRTSVLSYPRVRSEFLAELAYSENRRKWLQPLSSLLCT